MDRIPPEIFEMIIIHLGGQSFVNIRRTCKRLKMLADYTEMKLEPYNIWYRYAYKDFSAPCIGTVLPCLRDNEEKIGKGFIWKTIYSCLFRSKVQKEKFTCKHTVVQTELFDVTTMFFIGQQLICYSFGKIVCIGIQSETHPKQVLPITVLRCNEHINRPDRITHEVFSTHHPFTDNSTIIYKPLNIGDQNQFYVTCCKEMMQSFVYSEKSNGQQDMVYGLHSRMGSSHLQVKAHEKLHEFAAKNGYSMNCEKELYGSKVLLATFYDKMLFCHTMCSDPKGPVRFVCSEATVNQVKSIRMLENLLICIFTYYPHVQTNVMMPDNCGRITLGDWKKIDLCGITGQSEPIVDLDVLGQSLVAISALGNVFMSDLEELSHDWIQKKFLLAYDFSLPGHISLSRVCMDVNDGLVIAILDSAKHIILLFIDKI